MTEAEQLPPQSATATATATTEKYASFRIWPPSDRTRDAVKNRVIETLSTPSILSKRYGTILPEEAVEAARRIEDEAYEIAGRATGTDDDGIEILRIYSNEISRRMLDTVKARPGQSVAPETPPVGETAFKAEKEEDAGSTAPPQSEKIDSAADDE